MHKNKSEPKIEVACAGCGRTQSVRISKIQTCEGYTCSLGSCKLNPKFNHPVAPSGYICEIVFQAAGSFSGWKIRPATEEEMVGMERAKAIRDAGMNQITNERLKKLLDF